MKYGDIVRNKNTGQYGIVRYSFAGASVHAFDEENQILIKSFGDSFENIKKDWEICDMPEGYEWDNSKLYIKKIK